MSEPKRGEILDSKPLVEALSGVLRVTHWTDIAERSGLRWEVIKEIKAGRVSIWVADRIVTRWNLPHIETLWPELRDGRGVK